MRTIFIVLFSVILLTSIISGTAFADKSQGTATPKYGKATANIVCGDRLCSEPEREQMVGNDRDEHGCIPSAGYLWSEEKQQCVRPWEENTEIETQVQEETFEKHLELFDPSNPDSIPSDAELLFVQVGKSGSFLKTKDGYLLTIFDASLQTIYFTDRPYRITGHMTNLDFVDGLWNDPIINFKNNPPNAVLTVFEDNVAKEIVLELQNPKYVASQETLQYDVVVLHEFDEELDAGNAEMDVSIPEKFGHASLFIDTASILGKWPTPVPPEIIFYNHSDRDLVFQLSCQTDGGVPLDSFNDVIKHDKKNSKKKQDHHHVKITNCGNSSLFSNDDPLDSQIAYVYNGDDTEDKLVHQVVSLKIGGDKLKANTYSFGVTSYSPFKTKIYNLSCIPGSHKTISYCNYDSNVSNADFKDKIFKNSSFKGITNSNFQNADFSKNENNIFDLVENSNFAGATFEGQHTSWRSCNNVVFDNVNFKNSGISCDGKDSSFRNADFTNGHIGGQHINADFTGANFNDARISYFVAINSNLSKIDFTSTNFVKNTETTFNRSDLSGADFNGANLQGVDFSASDLTDADFNGANLRNADFTNAYLSGVDFTNADLSGVDFTNADLSGVDLSKTHSLEGCISCP